MGLAKNIKTVVAETPKAESGTHAALARLKAADPNKSLQLQAKIGVESSGVLNKPAYKQRDFDAEARGKTRCVQFEAALMSPAIAGMQFNTMEEYLKLVKQAADAGVAYSFQE